MATDPPLVCILSSGDWPRTNRAAASARRFGLAIRIGLTRGTERGAPDGKADIVRIAWSDDFAAARNALAEGAEADYLLWLDSDETLAAYPEAGGDTLTAPWYGVTIRDRADLSPRLIARIQRNDGTVRWQHAIHEEMARTGGEAPEPLTPLAGARIEHSGYDDDATITAKLARNARIVAAERAKGHDYYALALEEARTAEAGGGTAIPAWLAAFEHPSRAPAAAGGFDRRVEAARALAEADYPAPARSLLAENPRLVDLHFALLACERRQTGSIDAARLDTLCRLFATGTADSRYSYPSALQGASRARIIEVIGEAAGNMEGGAPGGGELEMTERYRRVGQFDTETLDEDLILMNTETFEVVTLNPTARIVWESFAAAVTIEEIATTFEEAFPDADPATLRADILQTVRTLIEAELVEPSKTDDGGT